MKVMRNYEEIYRMLVYLDNQRKEYIQEDMISLALSVAGQIELLKWVLVLEDKEK